jgi:hypothetical protein
MRRQAALAAFVGAIGGVLDGVAFVILENVTAVSILLMLGGLLSTVILFHLGTTLFPVNESAARWVRVPSTRGGCGFGS